MSETQYIRCCTRHKRPAAEDGVLVLLLGLCLYLRRRLAGTGVIGIFTIRGHCIFCLTVVLLHDFWS